MKPKVDYSVYLVTDRQLMTAKTVEDSVEQAIAGGCTLVQLREKDLDSRAFYQTALRVKAVTDRYQVPLLINDRMDIALAVGAQGLHVGQEDLPVAVARKVMGEDAILGVSASTVEEAVAAQADGADYLGVGAMFATSTKADADAVSMQVLAQIRAAVTLPIVVIGGINARTIPSFAGTGVDGMAVVSAIVGQPDITAATRHLKALWQQTMGTAHA